MKQARGSNDGHQILKGVFFFEIQSERKIINTMHLPHISYTTLTPNSNSQNGFPTYLLINTCNGQVCVLLFRIKVLHILSKLVWPFLRSAMMNLYSPK